MKTFDLAAAKLGAKVCTRDGREARILCFDFENDDKPIVASILEVLVGEEILRYSLNGLYVDGDEFCIDLMMADDDYEEKLERGEYRSPEQTSAVWQEAHIMTPEDIAKVAFSSPFDEAYWRKMYAGMAMQGLCAAHGTSKNAEHIARGAVECADALIEELKKEKQ